MMDELIKIISGTVLGGFLGYFIRLFIEHRLAIDRIKENIRITEFNKAASDFRAAFAPTIVKFNLISDFNAIDKRLRDELIPQGVAIERFRPFVAPEKQEDYQEAWENYHQTHKREGISSVDFLKYAMGEEQERFKLFKKNIHAILQFTK